MTTCVEIEKYLRLVHATALHHGIDVLLPQLWLPVVVAHIGIYLFSGQIQCLLLCRLLLNKATYDQKDLIFDRIDT